MLRSLLAAAALASAAATPTAPVVKLFKVESGVGDVELVTNSSQSAYPILDASVNGFSLRLEIVDADEGFHTKLEFASIGSIKGTHHDYGYSVGAAVTSTGTITGATYITKHNYPITIGPSAMGEFTITLNLCTAWKTGISTGATAQMACAPASLKFHIGFRPSVVISQPDLAPSVSALINAVTAPVLITVSAGGGSTVEIAVGDDAALFTKGATSGADITDVVTADRVAALTTPNAVVYKKAVAVANDLSGSVIVEVAKGLIKRGDGVLNINITVTRASGCVAPLTLTESTAETSPAKQVLTHTTSSPETVWFNGASEVELSMLVATTPAADLNSAGLAYATLFTDITAPGDALAAFKLKASSVSAPTHNTGKYVYTLDLKETTPLPGVYTIAVRPEAIKFTTSLKSAGVSLDFNIGLPVALSLADANLMPLMDTTAATPKSLPIAVGATTAESATVYAVVTITLPPNLRNATALAVGMAEYFNANIATDALVGLTLFVAAAEGLVETTNKKRVSRVVNSTVSFFYQIDPANTNFGTVAKPSIISGAFCTRSTEQTKLCTAFVRQAMEVVKGQAMPKAAGVLHPDGNAFSMTSNEAILDVLGAPYVLWATAMASQDEIKRSMPANVAGTGTAADIIVRGPVHNGVVATIAPGKIDRTTTVIKLTHAVADFKTLVPGTYVFEVPAGKYTNTVPVNARSIFTITVGFDVRFLPGVGSGDRKLVDFLPRRDINGPFLIKDNDVRMRLHGAELTTSTKPVLYNASRIDTKSNVDPLDDVAIPGGALKGVFAASDTAFKTNLAAGLTYASVDDFVVVYTTAVKYIDFRMGLGGLKDGEYVFVIDYTEPTILGFADRKDKWLDQQVRVIIDRTAPAGASTTFPNRVAGNVPAPIFANVPVSRATGVPVPSTLFSDAGSAGLVKLSVDNAEDLHGMTLVGSSLSNAALVTPVSAFAPTGNAVLKLKATDEAGNVGEASFTVQVRSQPGAVLTLIDRRGVQTRTKMFTGSASAFTGTGGTKALPVKVVVDYDEAVTGVTKTSLICALDSGVACPYTTAGVVLTATPGGRRYTFDFSVLASLLPSDTTLTAYVPSTGVTTLANGFAVRHSNAATAVVDTSDPLVGRFSVSVIEGATVSIPVPGDFCVDNYSSAGNLRLTVSSPSTGNGLTFVPGAQGTAAFTGKVTLKLAAPIEFVVTCVDQAGNTASGVMAIMALAKPNAYASLTTGPVDTFVLDATSTPLDFSEDQALTNAVVSKAAFPAAAFTIGTLAASERLTSIQVSLEGVQDPLFETEEMHEGLLVLDSLITSVTGAAVEGAYAGSNPAVVASSQISTFNKLTGRSELTIKADADGFTAAEVVTLVQGIQYYNARHRITSGNRVIRVTLNFKLDSTAGSSAILAMGSRAVKVTGVNDVPVIATFAGTPEWAQQDGSTPKKYLGTAVVVANGAAFDVTDADDDEFASATLTIWGKQLDDTNNAIDSDACDPTRDVLDLPLNYLGANAAPLVQGFWTSTTCSLTLQPIAPATRIKRADLRAAVPKVTYKNIDVKNPIAYKTKLAFATTDTAVATATPPTAYGSRVVIIVVTDSANSAALAKTASNVVPAGANPVAAEVIRVKLDVANVAPTLNLAALYSGVFSSADTFAASVTAVAGPPELKQLKFPLVFPAKSTGKKLFTVSLNISQIVADGKYVDGFHAGGAITDFDTRFAAAADVKLFFCPSANCMTGTVEITPVASPKSTATGTYFLGSDAAVSGADIVTVSRVKNDALSNSAGVTDVESVAFASTVFDYRRFDVSTIALLVNADTLGDAAGLGAYKFQITFDGAAIPFFVDLLWAACKDPDAGTTKVVVSGTDVTVETYILKALPDAPSALNWYGLVGVAVGDRTLEKFYSTPSLCRYAPVVFPPVGGQTADVAIGSKTFTATRDAIAAAAASLATASAEARSDALASLRRSAAGSFQVALPPNSLSGAASVDVTFATAPATTVTALTASLPSLAGVQLGVALKLGPAGTSFSKPVKVCVFSGDTTPGSTKTLSVASQIDAADETKGYKPFEALSDQSFDAATGEVCGFTTHFSVFAPIVAPIPTNPTIPKLHLMGGSCPNQCSGKGACRQDGKCVCFPGFGGYDCSLRSCPSAESWGEDQQTMHSQSECSGRGLCERSAGTCSCFDGYEGAACERSACPNRCSGHGKCRLLAELAEVQKAGYSDWESRRMQVCQCDGGYSGPDCSLRSCPFGDDPETNCYGSVTQGYAAVQRQVQKITLALVDPGTAGGETPGKTGGINEGNDQFAFTFKAVSGRNYTTPRIEGLWDGTVAAGNIAQALMTLPEFSVSDVTVSADSGNSANVYEKSFLVTFTGESTTGNSALLTCPANSAGVYGCQAPGCQPRFKQLRIVVASPALNANVAINEFSVLDSPPPVSATANNAKTLSQWTVETILTLRLYTAAATGAAADSYTYEFSGTKVFGDDGTGAGETKAVTIEETVVPPAGASNTVVGPYGLSVDLVDVQTYMGASTATAVTIKWRLPTCEVTQATPAESAYESVECSNRGLCDRSSGACECFNGYAGSNCAQQTVYL